MTKGLVVGLLCILPFVFPTKPEQPDAPRPFRAKALGYTSPIRFNPEARDPFEVAPEVIQMSEEEELKQQKVEEMLIAEEAEENQAFSFTYPVNR